jgi:hypothetical protein
MLVGERKGDRECFASVLSRRTDMRMGISLGGIILIIIVIWLLFGR